MWSNTNQYIVATNRLVYLTKKFFFLTQKDRVLQCLPMEDMSYQQDVLQLKTLLIEYPPTPYPLSGPLRFQT